MEARHTYRAKALDSGEWVTGYYLHFDENGKDYILTGKSKSYPVDRSHLHLRVEGFEWIFVDAATLCRCTGLTDKNGTLIYENDIILTFLGDVGVVKYGSFNPVVVIEFLEKKGITKKHDVFGLYVKMAIGEDCLLPALAPIEVIGNVFDNPTLLECEEAKE